MHHDGRWQSMDPSRFLQQAILSYSATGTSYALAQTVESKDTLGGQFERRFGFFNAGAPPGSSFSFKSEVAGIQIATYGGGGTTIQDQASSVVMVLKTHTIYHDSTVVRAAFQVHDAVGRTRVSTSGLTVTMTVDFGDSLKQLMRITGHYQRHWLMYAHGSIVALFYDSRCPCGRDIDCRLQQFGRGYQQYRGHCAKKATGF